MLRAVVAGVSCVVDGGRDGWQQWGVPRGGPMDPLAWRLANLLVGNPPDAPCVEIALGGAQFEALRPCAVALTGALTAYRDRSPVPLWTTLLLRKGQRLCWENGSGARAYCTIAGGVGATNSLGPRWLRDGDCLSPPHPADPARWAGRILAQPPAYRSHLRFLPGPHAARFDLDAFVGQTWRVSVASNRIGLRLQGEPLRAYGSAEVRTLPVLPGAIQVPPDGQPIVLMVDAQPTGGYPVLGNVLQADLHHAAQLPPGAAVRFEMVDLCQAMESLSAAMSPVHILDVEGDWLAAQQRG